MGLDFDKFEKKYSENINKQKKYDAKRKIIQKQKMKMRGVFLTFFAVLIIILTATNIVSGVIKINNMKYENNNLYAKIDKLNKDVEKLKTEINKKTQKAAIVDVASSKFNLQEAKDSQTNILVVNKKYELKDGQARVIIKSDNTIQGFNE